MSLLIKGYNELPSSCKGCPFASSIIRKYGTVERKCMFTDIYVTSEIERRDYFCPLVKIEDEKVEVEVEE